MKKNNSSKHTSKHLFAFYTNFPDSLCVGVTHAFTDQELLHRLKVVLRMSVGDRIILFNGESTLEAEISFFGKKTFTVRIDQIVQKKAKERAVTLLLPLLKKAALEEAVYNATELGVTNIQLISTHKSRQELMGNEAERLRAAMIAAAEQSKNYNLSRIDPVISYQNLLKKYDTKDNKQIRLVADPDGVAFIDFLKNTLKTDDQEIIILIGPEGGLEHEEFIVCTQEYTFIPVKLTQTIVRAVQAATISIGIVRSL